MITRRLFVAALLALSSQAFAAGFTSDRISVTSTGSGPDVVLIPGLASSPRVWAEMVKAVPGHRYHLVHVAGFAGKAKGANGEGPVAAPVAAEIARYIETEKLGKPAVIGHSMGGTIGLMLAARHPQSLSKLMVVDMIPFLGAMFGPPGTTADSIKPTANAITAARKAEDPATRMKKAEASLAGMIKTTSMRAGAMDDMNTTDQDVSANSFHELIVTDLMPELPNIKVPTSVLFVVPAGVPMTPEQMTGVYTALYARLPGVQLKYIPNAAHFIMWDQAEVFQREVTAFLK
jgi:pimeloyl-ACP methyl ester carboxylesterase